MNDDERKTIARIRVARVEQVLGTEPGALAARESTRLGIDLGAERDDVIDTTFDEGDDMQILNKPPAKGPVAANVPSAGPVTNVPSAGPTDEPYEPPPEPPEEPE
jgi:hypothetical protein